jgi:thiamine biosynthesis lipoprotein
MIRITILLTVLAVLIAPGQIRAQRIMQDPGNAFLMARQSGKKVLLVFSGSDWCVPCIRFEKKVLSDSSFRQFAGERLVVLEADFPQRKKVPASLQTQYEALAEQFNPAGNFPQIVLLGPDKKFLAILSYTDQSPTDFIRELRGSLQ